MDDMTGRPDGIEENVIDRLDGIEENVMSGLKDFQRATVERIDSLYRAGQKRILVSDEVGLGKTLIARGVVAKMAKLRREEGDRLFKVVYVCSNAAIARQNLQKLAIADEAYLDQTASSRLSMQHLQIFEKENDPGLLSRYIQLIPLTPDTSFRMTAGSGTVQERALMYAILSRIPELEDVLPELEVAMADRAYGAWYQWCKGHYIWRAEQCEEKTGGRYFGYMTGRLGRDLREAWKDGKTVLEALRDWCLVIRENGGRWSYGGGLVGRLRTIFAKISIDRLEPDLVIMDEFQRFRDLLSASPESDTGLLTQKFFHAGGVRMLLLSATPYKMYATMEEIDETGVDEHYSEFLSVMDFLNEGTERSARFRTVWHDYSMQLKELTMGDTSVLTAKNEAENAMYGSVCRTERITEKQTADIIDDRSVRIPVDVQEQDILSYVQMQRLLDAMDSGRHVPVDYVKSSPYLLSFMRDYKLKKRIEKYFERHPDEIRKLNKDTFWLREDKISKYEKIPGGNARLEQVAARVFESGMEKVLWIPPSMPYYEAQGVFKGAETPSKTLVFSSWEMVPRMLASLLSYEAERRTVGKLAKNYGMREVRYFSKTEKRYPPARLNFALKDDKPSAMTLFCLIYPSLTLADAYDPVSCRNGGMTISDIQRRVKEKIREKLEACPSPQGGGPDRRWYYMAPLLMDGDAYVADWLAGIREPDADMEEEEKEKKQKGFLAHLDTIKALYEGIREAAPGNLGRQPDDLPDVLADMAIASPAVCLLRTYRLYTPEGEALPAREASRAARAFIGRMNTPEATAVVELACGKKSDDAHWQNLLTYCRQGNLQAVLDEYAHMIASGKDRGKEKEAIHEQWMDVMRFRTAQYGFDTLKSFQKRVGGQKNRTPNIRTHFAVAFTKGDGKETDTDRKKTVRDAFNSPFWPFVLASTSIGQEGLDFHFYCRRIVHWNLPSNPIDLEQREGRINRFECLVIRQNVARRYGTGRFRRDVWSEVFEEASKREKTEDSSDLIPYWGLRETDDMIRIERIVPMYPLSRDEAVYERLIKILSMYRLTLGQARQEELLAYLFKNCDDPEKLKSLFINLSPFYRERNPDGEEPAKRADCPKNP